MPKLIIDGKEIEVEDGLTVIQACEIAGIEIPRFCYHERLAIAGNCRMCLVEMEKSPKPVASCALNVADGMVIHTNSEKVKKAREGVMEFLLINHPLDCPICDEAGECDLQDQAFKYGRPESRFHENKRSVIDKNMGPLINAKMTRCIHCTRCVRFSTDVAGIEEMGTSHRGEHMEITTYLGKAIESELSGNMIDICPVGALTSKPYAFKARSWELQKTESIDVMDAMCSNIRIDSRGLEVMRILPRLNEDINEEWISDKTRFAYDGLKLQRLDRPYIKRSGKFVEASFDDVISLITDKIKYSDHQKIGAISGAMADIESIYALKLLMNKLGSSNVDCNEFGYDFDLTSRGNYLFNTKIASIDEADLCVLIGANPREAAPVLNARLGRRARNGKMPVYRIGQLDNQTYPIIELGNNVDILQDVLSGKHELSNALSKSSKPMFIIGDGVYTRSDSKVIMSLVFDIITKYNAIRDDWNGFNILHNNASIVGAFDIGFVPKKNSKNVKQMVDLVKKGEFDLLYLLGADEIELPDSSECLIIYQGHHGDKNAVKADVILPSPAYTEKDGTYVNLEGRPQKAYMAVPPVGRAKNDWQIILDIANALKIDLGYKNLSDIRELMSLEFPFLRNLGNIEKSKVHFSSSDNKLLKADLKKIDINFYMTNSISRASITMAKCTKSRNEVK